MTVVFDHMARGRKTETEWQGRHAELNESLVITRVYTTVDASH